MAICSRHSSSRDCSREVAFVAALVVSLTGVAFFFFLRSIWWNNRDYDFLVKMVDSGPASSSAELFLQALEIATLVLFVSGAIGAVGVAREGKALISAHLALNGALAVSLLWAFARGTALGGLIGPTAARHAAEFCNDLAHDTYATNLHCVFAKAQGADGVCTQDCRERLKLARKMGGCDFLWKLCYDLAFSPEGAGRCIVRAGNSTGSGSYPVFTAPGSSLSQECCGEACRRSRHCAGFNWWAGDKGGGNGACELITPAPPRFLDRYGTGCQLPEFRPANVAAPESEELAVVGADQQAGPTCWRKELRQQLLDLFSIFCLWTPVLIAVAWLVVCVSSACAYLFQYTVVTRRQGPKGASALLMKMMCPCVPQRRRPEGKVRLVPASSGEDDSETSGSGSE